MFSLPKYYDFPCSYFSLCQFLKFQLPAFIITLLFFFQSEETEPDQFISEQPDNSLEYKNDGYIELVLKVMARMCDGQNQQLQVTTTFFQVSKLAFVSAIIDMNTEFASWDAHRLTYPRRLPQFFLKFPIWLICCW